MSGRSKPAGDGSFRRVFGAPLVLAMLSLVGLVAALLGDDIWDVVSWIALGIPVLLVAWYSWKPARR